MNDPISDMLIRIKNAYLARHKQVVIPFSRIKLALAEVLSRQGYIGKIDAKKDKSNFQISLSYQDGVPAMIDVKRMSSPGRRLYIKNNDLKKMQYRLGDVIVTTPKGLKTHREAIKENLGGELICAIW